MSVSDEFIDYVVDQLSLPGRSSVRRMFGGAGLYLEGVMFGLIADDVMYLKADDSNRGDFLRAGSSAFRPYPDKKATMSYYEVPADVLEDREELAGWATKALLAAKRKKRGRESD